MSTIGEEKSFKSVDYDMNNDLKLNTYLLTYLASDPYIGISKSNTVRI